MMKELRDGKKKGKICFSRFEQKKNFPVSLKQTGNDFSMKADVPNVYLNNFRGPLDLLFQLVEKREMSIYEVTLERITSQYLASLTDLSEEELDKGGDFLTLMSSLMLLKSRKLLPLDESSEEEGDASENIRQDIMEQLSRYYAFKELTFFLRQREEDRDRTFPGGILRFDLPVSSEPLREQAVFSTEMLRKIADRIKRGKPDDVQEEEYRIVDKIREWRILLQKEEFVSFFSVLDERKTKSERIVLFLALLELMKSGELFAENSEGDLLIRRGAV